MASRLRADPAIAAVVPDAVRQFAPLGGGPGAAIPAAPTPVGQARASSPAAGQRICPASPGQPLIEPEARTVLNVPGAQQIVTGTGIRVGIIADGIDPDNPDLIRANGQHVIFDYQDFSGFGPGAPTDGREAFLDAGTIAAQGNRTYDLSGFVNPAHPLPPGCTIKIEGIAPGANLVVLNVAGSDAGFFDSQAIQAIQWAVLHDHVNVLNESFGGNPIPNTENDPLALADRAAVAAGVTVVASTGDDRTGQQHRLADHHARRDRGRRDHHLPGVPPDHQVRHPAGAGQLAERQHHRAELRRRQRVRPAHRGRGRPW